MNWAASHLANKKELQTEGIAFKGREGVRQGIIKKKKKTKQRIISGKVTILRGGNEVIRRITLLVLTGKF